MDYIVFGGSFPLPLAMITPSKEEIRRKYGISEEHFEILTAAELPTTNDFDFQYTGILNGFQVWLGRCKAGALKVVYVVGGIGSFVAGT